MDPAFDYKRPSLTEPGVKSYLGYTLRKCHEFKASYYSVLLNIGLTISFFVILFGICWYKYKGKLTPEQRKEKDLEKKKYILSKIQNYQTAKLRAQEQLITGLPHWTNEVVPVEDEIPLPF